nr:uncharacterized protein CI109_007303 [Kwoniella shandongensis]KAA5524355.1 hypothetical protein CI109_007303 [Kwoniella shandongensis]
MVPTFWGDSRLGGEDGGRALEWLKGTEAERELNRKEGEGLSLGNMERFYTDISPHFPSTTNHPSRSPFLSYVYAISLIMTRAVVVDAYHGIAIVPFCDLLNHSSIAHTSFCCDAFVCPTCGSLTHCEHDTPAIERLAHLPRNFVETMEEKSNVVDMRVERAINAGEEVFMSYDENVGDGKLLVEWGFVERKGGGDGLVWSPRELLDGTTARAYMMLINSDHIDNASQYTQNAATHHHLIAQPNPEQNPLLNVNPKGEASIYLITAAYLQLQSEADDLRDVDEMGEEIVTIVEEVVQKSVEDESTLGPLAKALTSRIVNLIDRRLARMYEAETTLGELVNLHANLPLTATLERMAMALAIDERCVLEGALTRWRALLG